MFIKTIAVGPFAPGVTCGATVALPLLHCALDGNKTDVAELRDVARFVARDRGARRAIVCERKRNRANSE